MARKCVFSPTVTETDRFCAMSDGAQALYYHLGQNADSIGAIAGARRLSRSFGLTDPDVAFDELARRGYLIEAEYEGETIVFITHWWVNNTYRADHDKRTHYLQLAESLFGGITKDVPYVLMERAEALGSDSLPTGSDSLPTGSNLPLNSNSKSRGTGQGTRTPTEGSANEGEDKGSGRGSPKGEPTKPMECPRCHEKTLQLFLEQEHPQAQCINCQFVAYIDPDSGELSQLPL